MADVSIRSSKHARLSPSAAHRWMYCSASPWLEAHVPQNTSSFIDEGHDAHQLAALCLKAQCDTVEYLGCRMDKGNKVDAEMARAVQQYVERVRAAADGHVLLIEQEVPLTALTGEKEAVGTADALILNMQNHTEGAELQVHDLKFGRGTLVHARHNEQLALYALGALDAFQHLADFKRFRLAIHQPRRAHYSEWVCTREALEVFAQQVAQAAEAAQAIEHLPVPALRIYVVPGEKQCRFCRAKRKCGAYKQFAGK